MGITARYVIEDLTKVPARVEMGLEFRNGDMQIDKRGLVIVMSQLSEMLDALATIREAKEKGVHATTIVNVIKSSIVREADHVFYNLENKERFSGLPTRSSPPTMPFLSEGALTIPSAWKAV